MCLRVPPSLGAKSRATSLGLGALAGGVIQSVPCLSDNRRPLPTGLSRDARDDTGSRNMSRASKSSDQFQHAFECPEWPQCGCPGGVSRPECPALTGKTSSYRHDD